MALRYQTSRSNISALRSYFSSTCTNSYFKFVQEIEQEIKELHKASHGSFCKRCGNVKQRINEKDSEYKQCYVHNSNPLKLIESNEIIKSFINDCTEFKQCIRNRQSHVKKNAVQKQSKEDQCNGKSHCEKVTAPKEGAGGKLQREFVAESSGRSSEKQGPLSKVTRHGEEKPRDPRVTLQSPNGITSPGNADGIHVGVSELKVHNHSDTPEQAETKSKQIPDMVPPATTESNGPPSDSSQQNSLTGEPGSISTFKEKVLDENSAQSGLSGVQNVKGNPHGDHNLGGNSAEGHDGGVTVLVPSNSVAGVPRERDVDGKDSIPGNVNDRDSGLTSADNITDSSAGPDGVTFALSEDNNRGGDGSKNLDQSVNKGSTKSVCDNGKSTSGDVPCSEDSRGKTCNINSVFHTNAHSVTVPTADPPPVKGHVVTNDYTEYSPTLRTAISATNQNVSYHETRETTCTYKNFDTNVSSFAKTIADNRVQAEKITQAVTCNRIAQNGECGTRKGERSNGDKRLFQQEGEISNGGIFNSDTYSVGNSLGNQAIMNVQSTVDDRDPTEDNYHLNEISENDDVIPYQKYIISGLLPLVILLLLTLLIKCTPLGSIFTKKKRRKQKQMNEKLQRVLSEPSVTRERSVPFSYSAFEYST